MDLANKTKKLVFFSSRLLLVGLALSLVTACTKKKEEKKSAVIINLPASAKSKLSKSDFSTMTNADGWSATVPTAKEDFVCYIVVVSGPEIDMRSNTCTMGDGTIFEVGRAAGLIPGGGEVAIEVPSGLARKVSVFGVASSQASPAASRFPRSFVRTYLLLI